MRILAIAVAAAALFSAGCTFSVNRDSNPPSANTADAKNTAGPAKADGANKEAAKTESAPAKLEKAECLKTKVDGRKVDEKQTFPFDSKPFERGCFVTLHDPEFDDPPLESAYFIYKDGKEVFNFPNQFNGSGGGPCWIDAVAFEDLNGDGLRDVVLVGLCSAKSAPYNENMVYVNRGNTFTTSEEANYTLENMKTVKEVIDFVKKNEKQFFQ